MDRFYYCLNPTDILIQDTTLHRENRVQFKRYENALQYFITLQLVIVMEMLPKAQQWDVSTGATVQASRHNKIAPPFDVLLQFPT